MSENRSELRHRILREVIRNYSSLKSEKVDEYDYEVCAIPSCTHNKIARKGHDGPCDLIGINLLDLHNCLRALSPRKKEAIFYHVILDWKQKDAAAQMGITTVSVGQYVEQGLVQVAKAIWPEERT